MKAAVRSKYGKPDVLKVQEVPDPVPKSDELLIRVEATTVNRTDCGILQAEYCLIRFFTGLFKPGRAITGTDFAGKVEATGESVTKFKPGDHVWGFNDTGLSSHATYMTIAEGEAIAVIPGDLTYYEAAAGIEGAHYAYNFINKVKLKPGQKVLVNGATGAIGS